MLRARDGQIYVAWFSQTAGNDVLISRTADGATRTPPRSGVALSPGGQAAPGRLGAAVRCYRPPGRDAAPVTAMLSPAPRLAAALLRPGRRVPGDEARAPAEESKRRFKIGEVVTVMCQIGGKPGNVLYPVGSALP